MGGGGGGKRREIPRTNNTKYTALQPDELAFSTFTKQELMSLSVLEVTQVRIFDELGHPQKGSLHDPVLGPTQDVEYCDTCHQQGFNCPGHMGHIELPLTCFNPVFLRLTTMIVRGSCVFCHRLFSGVNSLWSMLLMAQLDCMARGQFTAVGQLAQALKHSINAELNADRKAVQHHLNELMMQPDGIDNVVQYLLGHRLDRATDKSAMTRNMVQCRSEIVKQFQSNYLFKRQSKCPSCSRVPPRRTTLEFNNTVRLDWRTADARKKDGSSDIKSEATVKSTAEDVDMDFGQDDASASNNKSGTTGTSTGYIKENQLRDVKLEVDDEEGSSLAYSNTLAEKGARVLDMQLQDVLTGRLKQILWRGCEIRDHLRAVWATDGPLLALLYPMLAEPVPSGECPLDRFFIDILPVMPPRFRPPRRLAGALYEHAQTTHLKRVIEEADTLRAVVQLMKNPENMQLKSIVDNRIPGDGSLALKMHRAYGNLQFRVNMIFDNSLDRAKKETTAGVRQLVEKKQGLFRKHMMGKRVNYACRSVITPDPYLAVDEVGVPVVFAKVLTFTEHLNDINLPQARKLVANGPDNYPGANYTLAENNQTKMIPDGAKCARARLAIARRLRAPHAQLMRKSGAIMRHVNSTDILMMNRQPTLHKPSIMGHRVRVLHHQKALRMNYAPCKAYNADFDGDEMNGHLVQDYVSRAEVFELSE